MSTTRRKGSLAALILVLAGLAFAAFAHAAPLADSAILFIGDGMGPVHIRLARDAAGGQPLALDAMPFSGLVTTREVGGRVTDSAAAGTALATGHKTTNGTIAMSPDGRRFTTILEICNQKHKSTGVITTDALTGATPASFMAHAPDRGMRFEIALQVAESRVPVLLGFWKDSFLPKSAGGSRTDGRDLIAEMRRVGYHLVETKDALAAADERRLLGLFDDGPQAPSVAEMVAAALRPLGTNADGFFLAVEAARIDWKSHDNDPAGAVLDTLELDRAVGEAVEYARQRGRTLVVVTADHETGGPSIESPGRTALLGRVTLPSEALAGKLNSDRTNIADVLGEYAGLRDLTDSEVSQIKEADSAEAAIRKLLSTRAGVTWSTTGHTGSPVRVFAYGPGADRFTGEMDNTDVPKRIAEILGIGPLPE
jgi:alkaline phosphatase